MLLVCNVVWKVDEIEFAICNLQFIVLKHWYTMTCGFRKLQIANCKLQIHSTAVPLKSVDFNGTAVSRAKKSTESLAISGKCVSLHVVKLHIVFGILWLSWNVNGIFGVCRKKNDEMLAVLNSFSYFCKSKANIRVEIWQNVIIVILM